MADKPTARGRSRGTIDALPSGSLRVRVSVGLDPLTRRRTYLSEIVAPGPKSRAQAERILTRLQREVDEQRNPVTKATMNRLLDRYLEVLDVEPTTRVRYEGIIRMYLRPAWGSLPLSKIDGELLDRFYAQLRECRERCGGTGRHSRHRTPRPHECDDRCHPLQCKPLSTSSLRAMHWILSATLTRAVRWRWIGHNPHRDHRESRSTADESLSPDAKGGRTAAERRVGGPRLGCLRLDRDDHRSPSS